METRPGIRPGSGRVPPDNPLVELVDITKSYREGDSDHVILSGAQARLYAGEFVALLGPSGSGKSTLLNLISGIDTPDGGRVLIGGVPITEVSERERTLFRRRHIGFVFQFFNLLPTLTVEENLLLPLELTGDLEDDDLGKARDLLDHLGLGSRGNAFPDRLSGGEQQRVAVARALIHEPDLVLADEPTGNLDSETGDRILRLLTTLARERGVTLLVVTHSSEIARAADRVLEIRDGELLETRS
jgi:putative ABC transport system ATP-binding protein